MISSENLDSHQDTSGLQRWQQKLFHPRDHGGAWMPDIHEVGWVVATFDDEVAPRKNSEWGGYPGCAGTLMSMHIGAAGRPDRQLLRWKG